MIFRFSNYILDVDVDRTRAFYGRPDVLTTSEKCTCAGRQKIEIDAHLPWVFPEKTGD